MCVPYCDVFLQYFVLFCIVVTCFSNEHQQNTSKTFGVQAPGAQKTVFVHVCSTVFASRVQISGIVQDFAPHAHNIGVCMVLSPAETPPKRLRRSKKNVIYRVSCKRWLKKDHKTPKKTRKSRLQTLHSSMFFAPPVQNCGISAVVRGLSTACGKASVFAWSCLHRQHHKNARSKAKTLQFIFFPATDLSKKGWKNGKAAKCQSPKC